MKVLLLNGSTRKNGCTYLALSEVAKELNTQDVETEIIQLGSDPVWDCIGCNSCQGSGHCVFEDDVVNAWIAKAREADGFVFGSPVYFAHPTGHILSVLDRMFYAGADAFLHKPGAAVVTARRAGTTASLDVLNKYFADMQMPLARHRRKSRRTWRDSRPCATWARTWHGCSSASRPDGKRVWRLPPPR